MNETAPQILNEQSTIDWESDNGRWGFTLGFDDTQDQRFEIEDVSAGAFVNFGDRFRIGGQFRFTSPEDDLFEQPRDSEDRQPEVKFESALRF